VCGNDGAPLLRPTGSLKSYRRARISRHCERRRRNARESIFSRKPVDGRSEVNIENVEGDETHELTTLQGVDRYTISSRVGRCARARSSTRPGGKAFDNLVYQFMVLKGTQNWLHKTV